MSPHDLSRYRLSLSAEAFAYRSPMKFGGRVVSDVTLLHVVCEGENRSGRIALGLGSMTMGVVWAWPSKLVDAERALQVTSELAKRIVDDANSNPVAGHPLEVCWQLAHRREQLATDLATQWALPEPIPKLAQLLAASPLEAALFDAHGKAAQQSSYNLLGAEELSDDLSSYLGDEFRGLYLDQFIAQKPQHAMPIYHLVGALDPLTQVDELQPVGDGLPETLSEWIARDGLTHLKIKLDGANSEWDQERILGVNRCASGGPRGDNAQWAFSLDFNERCANEEYVLRLLDAIEQSDRQAYQRIQYIEQPTARDLRANPQNTMHRVAQRLPVVIDESLVDYESLLLAREQGYSGVAIKACKGHAEALLMAAAAQHHKMFLCVQDLTCVGASFLHSASLTAHLPGAAAIEGNGRQYCPRANQGWDRHFPGMFDVSNGTLPTAILDGPGLGYQIPEELFSV